MPKLFPSQQPGEKILIAVREHWFRLFMKLAIIVILMVLPYVVRTLLGNNLTELTTDRGAALFAIILQIYYLALLIGLFIVWVLYYLNIHIVSEMRIVDMDQVGLLSHRVSELNIETVEDVSSQTNGLFGNLLDYGTVYVQTAGASERFQFENVPQPAKIANVILTLYEKERKLNQPNQP